MSSVEYLREFVTERLTAAAEEILGVFQKTIVRYEEEINHQRRLLEAVWKPEVKLHRIELPQQHVFQKDVVYCNQDRISSPGPEEPEPLQIEEEEELCCKLPQEHVCKEEDVLCNQERSSSLDQEEPEPPPIKEEEEDLCSSQEGEQLVLKQETETLVTPIYEEDDHSEDQTLDLIPDETLEESVVDMSVLNSVVSEANRDLQLLSNNSHVAESQDQEGGNHEDSGSPGDEEGELNKIKQSKRKSHTHNVENPTMLENHCSTNSGKKSFKCDKCGKDFSCRSKLQRHMTVHTGEKPCTCMTCGKRLSCKYSLEMHMRTHTGEKPYRCKMCGKHFRVSSHLAVHMRTHTAQKKHSCQTCGKDFKQNSYLAIHMRTHTSERPYSCKICGKDFSQRTYVAQHMKIHGRGKPYSCKMCGKDFGWRSYLSRHMKIHTGEKPYSCKTCGKHFRFSSSLFNHMRIHTDEKPYSCKICGKHFRLRSHLAKHVKIHASGKPYGCRLCGKHYTWRSSLAVHMRKHRELPEQHVSSEEEFLSDQEWISCLDQEEPEPQQIKEEELCC